MQTKTKAQRQAESWSAEADRPRREAERAKQVAEYHDQIYFDVIEALSLAGIDPDRLKQWLAGP